MKAINHYIIIENIKEGPKKVAGLIMTDDTDSDNRYLKAEIISTGNLVEGLKDGDVVYYDKHAGHDISYKEKLHRVIRSGDVVLVEQIKPKPKSTNLKHKKQKQIINQKKKNYGNSNGKVFILQNSGRRR